MKYYYDKQEIRNIDEWKKAFCASYSGKEDDYHWQPGRSGERLANDFIESDACGEETMRMMVSGFLHTDDVSLDKAFIEYSSKFDEYSRRRMQDLAIFGNAKGKSIFIGVEAKVDESFGSYTVSGQRNNVKKMLSEGVSTDAGFRLDKLVMDFLEEDEIKYGKLRYQLLYYLAGSFREEAEIIFMPVIVYKTTGVDYHESKGTANQRAYKRFMESLGFKAVEEMVSGNFVLAYHNIISAPDLKGVLVSKEVFSCYIVK